MGGGAGWMGGWLGSFGGGVDGWVVGVGGGGGWCVRDMQQCSHDNYWGCSN